MKVLLICKGEYRYFFPAIARALRERCGATVDAIAFSSAATRMLRKTDAFDKLFNLASYLKSKVPCADWKACLETLNTLENVSDSARVNTMIHADRIICRYSQERIAAMLAVVCEFWENILKQLSPDIIVGEVACATEWIGWLSARKRGMSYLIPCPTPVANRFFFLGAPNGIWKSMEAAFRRIKQRELTYRETSAAEEFIRNFRAAKMKPPFLRWAQRSPLRPEFARLARRAARIPFRIRSYSEDRGYDMGSYHGTPPWRPVWEDAVRIVRHIVSEGTLFEHHCNKRQKSVYFPLHVQPEFTTDVRAPFFTNQVALVENISKSVPVSYQVLVKEHPGMKGERRLSAYRALQKLHNVRLLSPSLDSHDLIQASDVVLTITGSSAWEAILYGKPVIAFGPLCYGFYDLIYRCGNVADLPGVLSDAIERFVPNHELLLKFVWAFFQTAYKLQWGDPVRQPQIMEKSNVEKVAAAIAAELVSKTSPQFQEAVPA